MYILGVLPPQHVWEPMQLFVKFNGGRVPNVQENNSHYILNQGLTGYTILDAVFLLSDNRCSLKIAGIFLSSLCIKKAYLFFQASTFI